MSPVFVYIGLALALVRQNTVEALYIYAGLENGVRLKWWNGL